MKKRFAYLLICFFSVLAVSSTCAQNNTDSLYKSFKDTKYLASDLLGKWVGTQGTKGNISFIDSNNSIIIIPITLLNPYHFSIDSSKNISAVGFLSNWPPYYCILNLKEKSKLEVIYFQFTTGIIRRQYFIKEG